MKELESFSVSSFLALTNECLLGLRVVVHGEVSSIDMRGNYLFFKLKDEHDESVLPCFMWRRSYDSSGVALTEGMKVSALGVPEIYAARGSFSFQVAQVKETGEGALKKRYDELKKKLELEGLFAAERKRQLPEMPQTIGLITSATGAVIHDFKTNLGNRGIRVLFHDTRVEGQFAESDILRALRYFRKSPAELVVVIRGGGSLESLAAWNSESVVRELSALPVPVIAGIGHDKDVPLSALAADVAVSTPTAAAEFVNRLFDEKEFMLEQSRGLFLQKSETLALRSREAFLRASSALRIEANRIFEQGRLLQARVRAASSSFERSLSVLREHLSRLGEILEARSPERALALGWSIIRKRGKILRSVRDASVDDSVQIRVSDGMIEARIAKLK